MRGLSDTLLNGLWRKAVLKNCGNKCFVCKGAATAEDPLEAHHVCKRRHLLTRWDPRNGVAVHKYDCHEYAAGKRGESEIREWMGDEVYFEIDRLSRKIAKDWCFLKGITVNEFKKRMKDELIGIIKKFETPRPI
jgi:hypothetical protein